MTRDIWSEIESNEDILKNILLQSDYNEALRIGKESELGKKILNSRNFWKEKLKTDLSRVYAIIENKLPVSVDWIQVYKLIIDRDPKKVIKSLLDFKLPPPETDSFENISSDGNISSEIVSSEIVSFENLSSEIVSFEIVSSEIVSFENLSSENLSSNEEYLGRVSLKNTSSGDEPLEYSLAIALLHDPEFKLHDFVGFYVHLYDRSKSNSAVSFLISKILELSNNFNTGIDNDSTKKSRNAHLLLERMIESVVELDDTKNLEVLTSIAEKVGIKNQERFLFRVESETILKVLEPILKCNPCDILLTGARICCSKESFHELISKYEMPMDFEEELLYEAARFNVLVLKYLVEEYKVDPSANNNEALEQSVEYEHYEAFRYLFGDQRVIEKLPYYFNKEKCYEFYQTKLHWRRENIKRRKLLLPGGRPFGDSEESLYEDFSENYSSV